MCEAEFMTCTDGELLEVWEECSIFDEMEIKMEMAEREKKHYPQFDGMPMDQIPWHVTEELVDRFVRRATHG